MSETRSGVARGIQLVVAIACAGCQAGDQTGGGDQSGPRWSTPGVTSVFASVSYATRPDMPAHAPVPAFPDSIPPPVATYCGMCHALPHPEILERDSWQAQLDIMYEFLEKRQIPISEADKQTCSDFYLRHAPGQFAPLPPDTVASDSFQRIPIGTPVRDFDEKNWTTWPKITHVNFVDLDRDGREDILVSDAQFHLLSWLHREGDRGRETPLAGERTPIAGFKAPVHSEVFDLEGDGDLDIVVAILGNLFPTDDLLGRVVLLVNDGRQNFAHRTLLRDMPRIADVRPADLDGDGDWDLAIAMFGMFETGQIAWLEQEETGQFTRLHTLSERNGCSHAPVGDVDGDGHADIVALITQEFEEIVAFVNRGEGHFERHLLFQALNPSFGSSGIELVDLDGDGDLDVLFTNGDGFDQSEAKPYHGVQWLENLGDMRFAYRDLTRFYGAYSATAGDLDLDGDMDIVVANCFMSSSHEHWEDLPRQGMIWLENDGQQHFTRHAITTSPAHIVSADLGDLNEDGQLDIISGGMNVFPPFPPLDRIARMSLWLNRLQPASAFPQ